MKPTINSGLGLRKEHYEVALSGKFELGFFEVVSENFMNTVGKPLDILVKVRERYPVALHGVSLNIASTDELSLSYLKSLKELESRVEPWVVSDHLCWTGAHSKSQYDLLPLPQTEAAVEHICSRIDQVQNFLGHQLCLENISTYLRFDGDEMEEHEFVSEILKRSGAGLLLDINNVYVNSVNHNFCPRQYIDQIPADSVVQYHLAGHTDMGEFLFDTHDQEISTPVWDLYAYALERVGHRAFLIERDDNIPNFKELLSEVRRAESYGQKHAVSASA